MNPIISDERQVRNYYQMIFGDLILDDEHESYWLSINAMKKGEKIQTQWCPIADEDKFVRIVSDYVKQKQNVYLGLGGRTEKQDKYHRGTAKDVGVLPGVWIEIDYGNEGHSSDKYPPTLENAMNLVREFPLQPTMIIHSGNGIHCYWLFKEFWTFEPESSEWERAKTYVERFQLTIKSYADRYSWKVDNTCDISRILRVSGTFNFKSEQPKKVEFLEINENARYDIDELESYFVDDIAIQSSKTFTPTFEPYNGKPSQWKPIVTGCGFIRHAVDNAETLTEPQWYRAISIAARCVDGDKTGNQIAHEISEPHPDYTPDDTEKKIKQALTNTGPYTCEKIASETNNEFCASCQFNGQIRSPITLGMHTKPDLEKAMSIVNNYLVEIEKEQTVSKRNRVKLTEPAFITACSEVAINDLAEWETIKIRVQELFGSRAQIKALNKQVMQSYQLLSTSLLEDFQDDTLPPYFKHRGNQLVFIPTRMTEEIITEQPIFTLGKDIFYYENGKYHKDGESKIRKMIRSKLGEHTKRAYTEEVLYDLHTVTKINENQINREDGLISVENGLLNWQTGELLPHTPERISTIQLPITYNPHAMCPNIERFLHEIAPPEDVVTLIEWVGYHLLQNTKFQKGMIFLGGGKNGKSVLIDLLGTFIGQENISNVALQDLEHDKFKRARLFGKVANLYSDIPITRLDKSDVLKVAIAGDVMDGEYKGVDSFSFRNFAKLTFSANERPSTADITHGFFRRWILIDFPNTFIDGVNADPDILAKLTTKEELSGLLNLAVVGLKRLHKQKQFSISETSKQLIAEWQKEVDNVSVFLEECCVKTTHSETYMIAKDEMYRIYREWCVESGYMARGRNNFYKRILQLCPHVTIERKLRGGKELFIGIETTLDTSEKYLREGFTRQYPVL